MRLPAPHILSAAPSLTSQQRTQPVIVKDFRFLMFSMPAPPPRSTAYAPPVLSKSRAAAPPFGGTTLLQEGFCGVSVAVGNPEPDAPLLQAERPAFSRKVSSTRRTGGIAVRADAGASDFRSLSFFLHSSLNAVAWRFHQIVSSAIVGQGWAVTFLTAFRISGWTRS